MTEAIITSKDPQWYWIRLIKP